MGIARYIGIEIIYVAGKDDEIMIAVIIGTHGIFSEEILKSAEMIFGVQENVGSVTFQPGEGIDALVEKIQFTYRKNEFNRWRIVHGRPFWRKSI